MSLVSRFFSGGNPTSDWPPATGASPQVSLERQALETFGTALKFGAPLEAARFLGRPDRYATHGERFVMLSYDQWGIELEFEANALSQVSFLIGEEHRNSTRPNLVLAVPKGPDGLGLSPQTTKEELIQRFGQPETLQDLEHTVVLYYDAGPLISEYQVEKGTLTAWDVYVN
jgi:hypothetical protein